MTECNICYESIESTKCKFCELSACSDCWTKVFDNVDDENRSSYECPMCKYEGSPMYEQDDCDDLERNAPVAWLEALE